MSLSVKDPNEKINITFDFSGQYTTVTGPAVTITEVGSTTDIAAMKASAPVITSLNKVIIPIQGGTSGVKYELRCQVTTDTSEIVVAKDVLSVKWL